MSSNLSADIGGGVVADTDEYSLADIPLCWMVHEAMRAQCGILFDGKALARLGIPTHNIFKLRTASSSTQSHTQPTLHDYVTPRRRAATLPTGDERPSLDASSSPRNSVFVSEPDDHTVMDERLVKAAKQPISDQLRGHKSWWILELIPTKFMWLVPVLYTYVRWLALTIVLAGKLMTTAGSVNGG